MQLKPQLTALAVIWVCGTLLPQAGLAQSRAGSAEPGDALSQFDTSGLTVPRDEILSGGPPKDGIPALTDPKTAPVSEARFAGGQRVVVVTVSEEARAYPINILNWHEAINDRLGGTPIAVIYCPLCDSVSVVDRRLDGKVLEFGISGLLHQSNVLLYDRQDHALWSQVGLEAISGPHVGTSLKHVPWQITTFERFQQSHPNGTVVTTDTGHFRDYGRNPYRHYLATDRLMFPLKRKDDRLPVKEAVVGVRFQDEARAYPVRVIREASGQTVRDRLAGETVELRADADGTVRVVQVPDAAQVVHTFWFTWAAFHPETSIYGHKEERDAALPPDMVLFDGGTFAMGSDASHADERPVHEVRLDPFLLDRHEVTNAEFAAFVEETGYVTTAERDGYAWGFLEGDQDFRRVEGASWRHPEGSGSSIDDRMNHPVVCVSWHDAVAYAEWAGKRLPTEPEWEYAARSGGGDHIRAVPSRKIDSASNHDHSQERPSGAQEGPGDDLAHHHHHTRRDHANDLGHHPSASSHAGHEPGLAEAAEKPARTIAANVWHGQWPHTRRRLEGSFSTTPVGSFSPNDAGLFDMIGNVWEWTADWYAADYYATNHTHNPPGPPRGTRRVARGGSWFCSPDYCAAYNSHYRGASPPEQAFNNVGFRCAADVPAPSDP